MGEYASGYHKKLFETKDLGIQSQLWKAAELHDQAHRDEDEPGAYKQLEYALKIRGLEVTEGGGDDSNFFRRQGPMFEIIEDGLFKIIPFTKLTSV